MKALVQRHADRPFAILGVNTDADPAYFREQCAEHGVTWPNVFAGKEKALPKAWGVQGYPTAFLIDAEGLIRKVFVGVDPEDLDTWIARLLAEAEAGDSR
jgi:hypothetical protein